MQKPVVYLSVESVEGQLVITGPLALLEHFLKSLRPTDGDSIVARTTETVESLAHAGDHSGHPRPVRAGDRPGGTP